MDYSGDYTLYAALSGTPSGDQTEALATGFTGRPGPPANGRRFIWLSVALVVTALAVVILVIMTTSAPPCLPSVAIDSFTVSSLSFSAASTGVPSGDFSITLAVRNPNKKAAVRLGALVAGVYHGVTLVAESPLPPMYQAALAERTVTARLVAAAAAPRVRSRVDEGVRLEDVVARGGAIRFRVEATCRLAFDVNGVDAATWRKVSVCCDDVPVRFGNAAAGPPSGRLIGPARPCTVK